MDIQRLSLNLCPLREWVLNDPSMPVIIMGEESITRIDLDQRVEQIRLHFDVLGVQAGDRVVVPVHDPLDAILLLIASLRSGWVFCPINIRMPESQLSLYCESIAAKWVVGEAVSSEAIEGLDTLTLPAFSASENEPEQSLAIDPDELCDLIATSGTTGIPKAVCHSYANHWYSAKGSETLIPLQEGDQWFLSLPLFHVGGYGIVIRCLLAGAAMVINSEKRSLGQLLINRSISHLSLVNTQLHRLLKVEGCDLKKTSLQTILLGGGYASRELVEVASHAGIQVMTTYGMTEMSSQVCTGEPLFIESGVTSGRCLPYRQIAISDTGEILVKGETLSAGYYHKGTIKPLFDSSGWYHTGDKGEWIDNQIKVIGRIDNMLISGGENIHPEEVELALLAIEGITQAVVVAVDHEDYGQRPWAFVETVTGECNELFTKQQLEGSISRFKIPDVIRLFPTALRNSGLKPNRHVLQKMAQSEAQSAKPKPVY